MARDSFENPNGKDAIVKCKTTVAAGAALMLLAIASPHRAAAQPAASGFSAKPILVASVVGVDDRELVLNSIVIEPGASSPHHGHPGECYGSVVEGTVELVVDGQPPQRFTAGQAWYNPRGRIHHVRNVGTTPARLLNTLIVDRGQPRIQVVSDHAD
jgi:quercetin dioxygenase-like cupin family protein